MVKGLDRFREYFVNFEDSYALIGGVACDILFNEAGLPFRATKDFDVVVCVEVISKEFGKVFAQFLEAGGYQARERATGHREFYRFHRPSDDSFPTMIELFARRPCGRLFANEAEFSPIPVEEEVISLSAILLDDEYFRALHGMRRVIDDICIIDERILIPFKARAFLDLSARKIAGEVVDSRHIRKHRADVFRLAQLLPGSGSILLGISIRDDLAKFLHMAVKDPNFVYKALNIPITLADATAVLQRFYRLELSNQDRRKL